MKKTFLFFMALCCLTALVACDDTETYGDKKDKERSMIREFIAKNKINVIDEPQFHQQGDITNLDRNEYVYLTNTGVYMQIVRKGCGTKLQDGENCDLLMRFYELCLADSTIRYNDTDSYNLDIMNVRKSGSTLYASFTLGLMLSVYGESVPAGLLVPFNYICVGRPRTADEEIAKVRLIVPHSQGHSVATSYVYPYYYEITFQRKIDNR